MKKQEAKKVEEPAAENKEEESNNESIKDQVAPSETVLEMFMHCEDRGCKVRRSLDGMLTMSSPRTAISPLL